MASSPSSSSSSSSSPASSSPASPTNFTTYSRVRSHSHSGLVTGRHADSPMLKRNMDSYFSMYLENGGFEPSECQVHGCCNAASVTSTAYLGEDSWYLTRICKEHRENARESTLPLRSDAHLVPYFNLRA